MTFEKNQTEVCIFKFKIFIFHKYTCRMYILTDIQQNCRKSRNQGDY